MKAICVVAMTLSIFGVSRQLAAQTPQPLPQVNLGATSFLDGSPPAGPGVYFFQYLQYYGAHRLTNGNGDTIPLPNPDFDSWVSLSQVVIMPPGIELPFGAKPALDILLPTGSAELAFDRSVPAPRDNGGGLGDMFIGPALQFDPITIPLDGDKGPVFIHRFEAEFILPTGEYSSDREINIGSNFASFNPYWAATLFLSPKLSMSVRAHYLWNDENDDPARILGPGVTSTKAGEAFHINFAAAYEVTPKIRFGVNGYFLKQTSDVEINGMPIPGFREQVLGIGPGLMYSFSRERAVMFNLYSETAARNRTVGTRMILRYIHKF